MESSPDISRIESICYILKQNYIKAADKSNTETKRIHSKILGSELSK